jgi:branched-chain amino acid transport system ATP-binding protein
MLVERVFDILKELRDDGVTILVVEQDMLRTIETADRTYVLRTGTIGREISKDLLPESAELATHYFGLD